MEDHEVQPESQLHSKPVSFDPYKVQLKGLTPSISDATITNYINSLTEDSRVKDVHICSDGNALVTFTEQQDFETLVQTLSNDKTGLKDCKLTLERVPYCTCVLVSGLSRVTTTDALEFYFENPRHGCGEEPSKIELQEDLGRAWIHFKNHTALETLLKKDHVLDDAELKIEPFYPFLGEEVCTKKMDVHPEIMTYIKTYYGNELQAVLDKTAIELQWHPKETSALITQTKSAVRDEIASAEGNRNGKLQEFLEDFEHKTFSVECDLFDEVADGLQKQIAEKGSRNFDLSLDASQFAVNIVGRKEVVKKMAKQIGNFIEEVTEERRLKESVVTHTESDQSSGQLAVMKKYGLPNLLQDSYKYTNIDIDDGNGNVVIHCPESKKTEIIAEILRFLARVDKEVVKLSERVLDVFLSSKGARYLSNALSNENLIAVLMIDEGQKLRNEAIVYAMNSDHCRKAVKLIDSFTKEKRISLRDESMKVVKGPKWQELIQKQQDEFVVHILLDKIHAQTLWISGVEQDVIKCYEHVKEHIDKYTIIQDCVDIPQGNLKFLFKVWDNQVRQITEELKESFLEIKPNFKQMKIEMSGNQNGIKIGKEKLLSYVEKIRSKEVIVDKPGMAKFFKSSQGSKHLNIVERDHSCMIEVREGKDELISPGISTSSKDFDVICSIKTPEGKTLSVCKDDLTKHPADVIVNAANEELRHSGGLAGAIVRVGGQQIQNECDEYIRKNGRLPTGEVIETSSGKLPCKRIIHIAGPRWGRGARQIGQKTKEEELLYSAIQKTLSIAKDYQSIAIPAVSSGIFGFPVDLCATTLIQSAIDFFKLHPHCQLSHVQFTNNDDPSVNAFETEMNRVFGDYDTESKLERSAEAFPRNASRRDAAKIEIVAAPRPAPVFNDSAFVTPEGVSISIKVGDIAQEHSDVLVNTAGSQLNLQSSSCAKAFSKAAGPELQKFCYAIAPIQVGDIGLTPPGKLNCKHVLHVVCSEWDNGNGHKILCTLLEKCLVGAENSRASSISIPAIGTGVLGFPRDDVARISFDEVIKFSRNRQTFNLKEVQFVVYYGDQPTVQSFQGELARRRPSVPQNFPGDSAGNRISNAAHPERISLPSVAKPAEVQKSRTSNAENQDRSSIMSVQTPEAVKLRKPKLYESKMGKITVQVEKGDITHEKTDAIGMFSDPDLDFENQGQAWAVIMASDGLTIDKTRQSLHYKLPIQHGHCVIFPTEKLIVGNLVVCSNNSQKPNKFSRRLVKCLKKAEKKEFKSISFPALGTGSLGLSSKDCANFMLSAAKEFSKTQPKSIQLIRIVVFQEAMINDFVAAMRKCSSSTRSFWQVLKSGVTSLKSKLKKQRKKEHFGSSEMFLQVYSGNDGNLRNAVRAVNEIMNEHFVLEKIEGKEAILDIDEAHMNEIRVLEQQLDCRVNVEKESCSITVKGLFEDVLKATTAIHDMLHKIVEAKHERAKAESIAKDVQWEYETDDTFTPYSVDANAKIEAAHVKQEEYGTFEIDGEEFTVNFVDMKEKSTVEGVDIYTNVKRRDLKVGRISVPDHWDAQPKSETGVENAVHIVELDRDSHEYLQVKVKFNQTCPSNQITKISRVQNPGQYKIYSIRKQEMDNKSGSNEQQLFHGTAAESCESINLKGFNRSYCGKNATVYGAGVYFAVNAEYSARSTYSPADFKGDRYMYLARVLTGDYTKGDSSIKVLPPKNPAQPNDTYDTTVDNPSKPTIFVVFYDGQAYPEYLIEFRTNVRNVSYSSSYYGENIIYHETFVPISPTQSKLVPILVVIK